MRKEFEAKLAELAKSLERLREEAKAKTVRWDYGSEELWSYFDFRRYGSDSSVLAGPDGALYAYAYDEEDRPIAVVEYGFELERIPPQPGVRFVPAGYKKVPTKEVAREIFVSYREDWVEVAKFEGGVLIALCRTRLKDRLEVESVSLVRGYYHHRMIEREGRRKKRLLTISRSGRVVRETVYGPHGEQSHFRVRQDGSRFQLYQPFPKGISVKSLKQTIRERLLSVVPDLVEKANITEPIYCVVLAYDNEGNDALPPSFAIGVQSERSKWLEQHGKRARDFIWNPAEFYHFEKAHLLWEDEALEEACDLLNSHLAEKDSVAPAIKLLVEVAVELNGITWPETVQRTDDFVVYAVDFELGHLRKNLKKILPAEKLAALKKNNLL